MMITGQKVVVCGAGGFIGGHLVKSLKAGGARVFERWTLSRSMSGIR